jgi:hypothetical protein
MIVSSALAPTQSETILVANMNNPACVDVLRFSWEVCVLLPLPGTISFAQQCFTILWQEPGKQALQVLNSNQEWIDVPPIPGTLVIKYLRDFILFDSELTSRS